MPVLSKTIRGLCPNGVSIIATLDDLHCPHGFTAGSFTWLTSSPPRVAFCLARGANSFAAFSSANGFSVNVLQVEHEQLARRFATKGVDKFAGDDFFYGDGRYPALRDAAVILQCETVDRAIGGDHLFVVGEVFDSLVAENGKPAVMYRDAFTAVS